MIPNTDINCGKCAAPIYSDCVMWSGQNLSCVTLLQDCCDTTLTKVIELLGGYVCNLSNVANYNIPVCMDSYNITDFIGMQNAMMDLICQQSEINVTGLTWGCTPSGTTTLLQDTIQAVIDQVNDQATAYNQDHFVVTGTTCSDKGVSLKLNTWTESTPSAFGSNIQFLSSTVYHTLSYLKNTFGDIRLNATVRTYNGLAYVGSGVGYKQLIQLPLALRPAQDNVGNQFVCYAYVEVAGTQPAQPTLGDETVTIDGILRSRIIQLNGKVFADGWVQVEFPFNASYHVYLQPVTYSLNS